MEGSGKEKEGREKKGWKRASEGTYLKREREIEKDQGERRKIGKEGEWEGI